jgi:hypothetical protein
MIVSRSWGTAGRWRGRIVEMVVRGNKVSIKWEE